MKTLAIDFGNTNTVLAIWQEEAARALKLPDFCVPNTLQIPSLIHFDSGSTRIGNEAAAAPFAASNQTFRWMKRYISLKSPYRIQIGQQKIDAREAAEIFLRTLVQQAESVSGSEFDELVFTVPVESFDHFRDWLIQSFSGEGQPSIRILDEVTAAAAGYGMKFQTGDAALYFDFGGSTMQAAVVKLETEPENRFHVLGKAGLAVGGVTLDRWIMEDVLRRNQLDFSDRLVQTDGRVILDACEQIKVDLSTQTETDRSITLTNNQKLNLQYSKEELESIFSQNKLAGSIRAVVQDALRQAFDRGIFPSEIRAVIPTGGGSMIPAVQTALEQECTAALMLAGDPLTAVAVGAAAFSHGFGIIDFIRHQYAVRVRDPKGGYRFQPIIEPGTRYPTQNAIKSLKLKASRSGQTLFGLAIYEISAAPSHHEDAYEVLFDENGAVRLMPRSPQESFSENHFWMNEGAPLFLEAVPAAEKGLPRFQLDFGINEHKMLWLTANDILTGKVIFERFPVVRLD
jgi:actin-like ATPase involved in cell morphogenesis